MLRTLSTLLVAALFVPAIASADRGERPCRDDVDRLCPDAKGDRDAVRECLQTHQADLSEACAARVEKRQARKAGRDAVKAACAADVQTHCAEAEGKKGVRRCLRSHADELSAECTGAIEAMKASRGDRGHGKWGKGKRGKRGKRGRGGKALRAACKADVQTLCADAKGDRRAVKQCLKANEASLSEGCSAAITEMKARRAARRAERRGDEAPADREAPEGGDDE